MRIKLYILLIICLLYQEKKVYSQENTNNITYFKKCFSEGNYELSSRIGKQILLTNKESLTADEQLRLLYNTLLSHSYTGGLSNARDFISDFDNEHCSDLFKKYLLLYKGTLSISSGQTELAKEIFNNLLKENDPVFLHDSIKAKLYHNLSVIYSYEEKRKIQLEYMTHSYELEKKLIKTYPNYANFNLSTEVYATTLYSRYKQFEKANQVFKEALALPFNHKISTINHSLYAVYIDFLIDIGYESRAMHYFKLLEDFYTNQSPYFRNDIAKLYTEISINFAYQNNFTNAILYANKALAITPLNKETLKTRYNSLNWLSDIYFQLGQNEKSIYYMHRFIEECRGLNQHQLALAYTSAGNRFAQQYKDELAYAYLDSAKHLYYNILKLPVSLRFENNLAWGYLRLEQFNQSLHHYERVTSFMIKNGNYTTYAIWDNMYEKAYCHIKLKQYPKAEELLKKANEEMLKAYPHLLDAKSNAQSSRFGKLYRKINISLAQCLYEQFENSHDIKFLKKAMTYTNRADKALEYLRSRQRFDRDRLVTSESFYDFTLLSAKVAFALYDDSKEDKYLRKAFEYVQKGKSYALLLGVNDKKYKLNSGVPLELINKLNHSKDRFDFYEQRYTDQLFEENSDSTLSAQLGHKMSLKMAEIDSLNDLIKRLYPDYRKLKSSAQYIDIDEIQSRLSSNQVVIDYYSTDTELFRFTILKDTYYCDNKSLDKSFKHNLTTVLNETSSPFIGQSPVKNIQKYASSAYQLYKVLLEDIDKITDGKELIIVPHGELSYLPFETLLTEDYSKKKPCFRSYPWLLKKQSVTYSYNTALLPSFENKPSDFHQVLAFAPEYTGSTLTSSIDLSNDVALDTVLRPLHGALKEIEAIEKLFKSEAYIGVSANKKNFIAAMQKNDILHLAMHSLNDEIQPFNSQMVFASTDSTNGSFKAKEIYNYAITSPLTILSSCSTGSGQRVKGEGLLSLARAFTFTGVEAQIMTLWPVHDESGANLIERFYKQLKSGKRKDDALRISKLNFINSASSIKSHPYYWGNYVLSGNTKPLKQKTPTGIFIYLLVFTILSVVFLYLYNKRKHL